MNNNQQMQETKPHYRIISTLGSGAGHIVFKAVQESTQQIVAMKIEKRPLIGQVEAEIQKLKLLSHINGVPQVLDQGKTKDEKCFLTTTLLSKNLQQVLKEQEITVQSVLAIGLSLITILEQIHKMNIIHQDIKPENIMISGKYLSTQIEQITKPGFVNLIDFGLATQIGKKNSKKKIFIGSLRYASRQSHNGNPLSFKDDLEGLIYVLIYLRKGKLPWQMIREPNNPQEEIMKIGEMKKNSFQREDFFNSFPPQFKIFAQYIDLLRQNVMPDYQYIKSLFKQMLNIDNIFESQNCERTQKKIDIPKTSYSLKNLELFNEMKPHQEFTEEDIYDTDTSIILLSDMVPRILSIKARLISDIE